MEATNATSGYNPAFYDPEPNCNNAWRMYRCVCLFLLCQLTTSARLTQPLEQEQDHVWTLVPLRRQSAIHHRHSAFNQPCFQAARARAVLLEGVLHQQKAGARRPLGARFLLLVASSLFTTFLLLFGRILIALFACFSHAPQVLQVSRTRAIAAHATHSARSKNKLRLSVARTRGIQCILLVALPLFFAESPS